MSREGVGVGGGVRFRQIQGLNKEVTTFAFITKIILQLIKYLRKNIGKTHQVNGFSFLVIYSYYCSIK